MFHLVLKPFLTSWKMLGLNINLLPNSQLPSSSLFSATPQKTSKEKNAVKGLATLHFLWVLTITITPNHYFVLKSQPSNNNFCFFVVKRKKCCPSNSYFVVLVLFLSVSPIFNSQLYYPSTSSTEHKMPYIRVEQILLYYFLRAFKMVKLLLFIESLPSKRCFKICHLCFYLFINYTQ